MTVGTMIRLERAALLLTVLAVLFPLKLEGNVWGVALFNVPMTGLLGLWFLRVVSTRRVGGAVVMWELAPVVLAIWFIVPTTVYSPEGLPKLMIWSSSLVLALYARRNYGTVFDFEWVKGCAIVVLAFETFVGAVQIATLSEIGNVQQYFGTLGETDKPRLIGGAIHRVVGTVGSPNMFGGLIVTLLPFLHLEITRSRGAWVRRYGLIVLALCALAMLVIAVSRVNAVVGLAGLGATWLLAAIRSQRGWTQRLGRRFGGPPWRAVVTFALVASTLVIMTPLLEDRFYGYTSAAMRRISGTEHDLALRLEQYRGAVISIIEQPVFGVGFANSDTIWSAVGANVPLDAGYAPHNVFLIVAVEGGIPALVLFLFFMTTPLGTYLKKRLGRLEQLDTLAVATGGYLLLCLVYIVPIHHGFWPIVAFLVGVFRAEVVRPRPLAKSLPAATRSRSSLAATG